MDRQLNIVTYASGPNKEKLKAGFIQWHSHFSNVNVSVVESDLPGNQVKILAADYIVKNARRDQLYILCDIDTKIIRFPRKVLLPEGKDVSIFCRKLLPSHLNNLSGFVVLRYNEKTRVFLQNWIALYGISEKKWFDDQVSLGRTLLEMESTEALKVNDLSRFISKCKFFWSTESNIFLNAYTHKGKNVYLIDRCDFRLRYIAIWLDTFLVPWNYTWRILRSYF